ncbi:MAG TPA: DUF6544 family protein [Planctomycetota bacterium]
MKFVLLGFPLLIAVALVAGAVRWMSATNKLMGRLVATRLPLPEETYRESRLPVLPAPVRRYFRAALRDGQRIVRAVHVEHSGIFNMSESGEAWKRFRSHQWFVARRPGFVWDARILLLPGMSVRVHDAYVAGQGILHASMLGLATVADLRGTPEVAQGELMRFLAEAAWFPTALLPSQGVHWEAVDDASARATLVDGATTASLLFRFHADGMIESVHSDARTRAVSGKMVPTPWEARWTRHEQRDGMRIPVEGEVSWLLPGGRKPYWRGTITAIRHDATSARAPQAPG